MIDSSSKFSIQSIFITIYLLATILLLAFVFKYLSINVLSLLLTYGDLPNVQPKYLFGVEMILAILLTISPFFIVSYLNSILNLEEENVLLGNLFAILVAFVLYVLKFESIINWFSFYSEKYSYQYDLGHFSFTKINHNEMMSIIFILSSGIIFGSCLYLLVIQPFRIAKHEFKIPKISYIFILGLFLLILGYFLYPLLNTLQFFNDNKQSTLLDENAVSKDSNCGCTEQNAKELAWSYVKEFKQTHDPYAPVDEWTNLQFSRIEKGADCSFNAYFDYQSNDSENFNLLKHQEIKKRIFCDQGRVSF